VIVGLYNPGQGPTIYEQKSHVQLHKQRYRVLLERDDPEHFPPAPSFRWRFEEIASYLFEDLRSRNLSFLNAHKSKTGNKTGKYFIAAKRDVWHDPI
jgi:hypothetical protein